MKHRSLVKMFLLFFVTLGLYHPYWLLKTRREMLAAKPGLKIASPLLLLLPFVIMVVAMLSLITTDFLNTRQDTLNGCTSSGLTTTDETTPEEPQILTNTECDNSTSVIPTIIFLVACASFMPLVAVWLWSYCKAVDQVTGEKISFAIALIVLLAVPAGINILIIQDGFNKLATPERDHSTPPLQ